MKTAQPLIYKDKYFKSIEKEINALFYEIIYKPIIAALELSKREIENAKEPLYIKRNVINADEIIAWAKSQGFKDLMPSSELHVTICYSRAGVESKDIERNQNSIYIESNDGRKCGKLGDHGATVLFFKSVTLDKRWLQMIEKHAASWDYDSYNPHITLSYGEQNIDLKNVKPFSKAIYLGEEIHEKPATGWRKKVSELMNSAGALDKAIRSGDIFFDGGFFYGSFNSKTSKELRGLGATYQKRLNRWKFSGVLPSEISIASASAASKFEAVQNRLVAALDEIDVDRINGISNIPDIYDRTIEQMESDYKKTMKKIAIAPKLTQAQKGILAAEYGQNLDKYIKDWAKENIKDLRAKVQTNAFEGRRSSAMIKEITKNYGVSKTKAKFLARQETSLLLSKFREMRYKDVGSDRYVWRGVQDKRERHDHKALEGKVIYWDSPPVTNTKTGARNHAGEDFGCRCVAVPIID